MQDTTCLKRVLSQPTRTKTNAFTCVGAARNFWAMHDFCTTLTNFDDLACACLIYAQPKPN